MVGLGQFLGKEGGGSRGAEEVGRGGSRSNGTHWIILVISITPQTSAMKIGGVCLRRPIGGLAVY